MKIPIVQLMKERSKMTLYKLKNGGFFAADRQELLPIELTACTASGEPVREVLLDGKPLVCVREGVFLLPKELRYGVHALAVDGVACEGIAVHEGRVKPQGFDTRLLLGALMRLERFEERLSALEKKKKKGEVNWLL